MRYSIGIDLGTTNSALAFVDTEKPSHPVQLLAIPQLTAAGKVDSLYSLPSFCYLVVPEEWPKKSLTLPWREEESTFVGQFAKVQGARVPTRLISSAKSWLYNVAAHRHDKILPIDATDLSSRLSPVEVSAKYLIHLRDAWNQSMAKGHSEYEMEEQEIILTVPASFDEVARKLTLEAARQAGFLHVTLLEEPQAAFYSWISQHEEEWQGRFKAGETILVCDVGGGTTDFSLIEVQQSANGLIFQRMAVGDHLLLGGDNMDIALAHYLEQKLQRERHECSLESKQWLQLISEARSAKETLLRDGVQSNETYSVILQGIGSSIIKGSLTTSITHQEVKDLLINGFFGLHSLEEALHLKKSRGFRTMGLPYEDEPMITKHLAHFLKQARSLEKGIDYLLFNGGTFKPEIFQHAIEHSLRNWFPQTALKRLSSASLDLAVARGGAYYGKARRGLGVSIQGGVARTYYLKIEVKEHSGHIADKALTLLPRGSQEGTSFQPDQLFSLRPNTPVAFHLLTSHVRLGDKEGELIDIDLSEMQSLPPIQTILRFGKKQLQADLQTMLQVRLSIRLTAIGTVELWLDSQTSDHQWNLEFQLRSATGQDAFPIQKQSSIQDETFEKGYLEGAQKMIEALFKQESPPCKPEGIMECLERQIGIERREWSPGILRELWGSLWKVAEFRQLSSELHARWWNLAGFFLRPGFGFPMDDFRIKELWKIVLADLKGAKSVDCQDQMWICFRRIAGGLNKGQQMQLANDAMGTVLEKRTGKLIIAHKGDRNLHSEKVRALASFERLESSLKIRLGDALMERIVHETPERYDYWALGRIGARQLFYGSIGHVVSREVCTRWIELFLQHRHRLTEKKDLCLFLIRQLSSKTEHRELNIADSVIQKIIKVFPDVDLENGLRSEHSLTLAEQNQIFGEQLPSGLLLELKTIE